jgi:ankyrin repeat protein
MRKVGRDCLRYCRVSSREPIIRDWGETDYYRNIRVVHSIIILATTTIAMAQLTVADLKEYVSYYDSPRDVGDVLVCEDTARLLIETSSSGNDMALQSLLSQPQWTKAMLEKPHCIYDETHPSQGPDDARQVRAWRISNLERALTPAAQNGHAAVTSTLFAFTIHHGIDTSDFITRSMINEIIQGGHAAVSKALASAYPNTVHFHINHGTLSLYEAVRLRKPDVVALLLDFGADPLHPVIEQVKKLGSYHSSLMSKAAMAEGPRMIEMLLEHGTPIAHTAALHTAARFGHLDTMRLLMQHCADVNEVLSSWHRWTPMHFAASKGEVDTIRLLEHSGARSDLEDVDGKTPARLLEERDTT